MAGIDTQAIRARVRRLDRRLAGFSQEVTLCTGDAVGSAATDRTG
jgi:hypothetical protein